MNTTDDREIDIEQLAWAVAEDGPSAHHNELAAVARTARAAGVAFVAADVLADRDASPVARQRAFGRIASHLESHSVASAARFPRVA